MASNGKHFPRIHKVWLQAECHVTSKRKHLPRTHKVWLQAECHVTSKRTFLGHTKCDFKLNAMWHQKGLSYDTQSVISSRMPSDIKCKPLFPRTSFVLRVGKGLMSPKGHLPDLFSSFTWIIMLRHKRILQSCIACITLWASLSGTFLQNSARFSYVTEGALFISTQLSTDAVSTLRKVWVLIRL